jgi:hypothetical protein
MSSQTFPEYSVREAPQAPISLPLRNLMLTFVLAVGTLAGAGALGGSLGHQMLIVTMGWPHIILGFLFYLGKVLRGEWRARSTFVFLLFCTLALWFAHYAYTITAFIAIYFTYHVFRDEVFIYFQTRARHTLRQPVKVAGLITFILLMFLITDPRPQHYRQDLRRADLSDAQLAKNGWTLISFEPISYSRGNQFYFYLQTPNSDSAPKYVTNAYLSNMNSGEIRISDRPWKDAADLVFQPHYAGETTTPLASQNETIPVSLKGGQRVGQTFTAEQENLDGFWLPTALVENAAGPAQFEFHVRPDISAAWPPLSPALKAIRLMLVFALLIVVVWKIAPEWKRRRSFWLYFLIFIAVFAMLQKLIRVAGVNGMATPVMFQLVVVFHYWSWYVFSIDKLFASRGNQNLGQNRVKQLSPYDRAMASFGSIRGFICLTVALSLVSAAGVIWYAKLHGPEPLRFAFDYSYFLYFLVLHVTLSFAPRRKPNARSEAPGLSAGEQIRASAVA